MHRLDLHPQWQLSIGPDRELKKATPTAAQRVLAAELEARGGQNDALSMMVSSVARMVQVGKASDSRWRSSL